MLVKALRFLLHSKLLRYLITSMIVGTTQAESCGATPCLRWGQALRLCKPLRNAHQERRCRFPSRQTFQEAAAILKISTARLRVLLMAGRVKGSYKSGKMWLMPLFNGKPIIKRKVGGVGFRPAKFFKRTG